MPTEPPAGLQLAGDHIDPATGGVATTEQVSQQLGAYQQQLLAIDEAIGSTALKLAGGSFGESFGLAAAIRQIDALITPDMMADVMWLMNDPLGFLTDRDPSRAKGDKEVIPYPEKVVKRCVIAAGLKGARFTGNEMNIISAKHYLTKEFFIRKVREFPGLTDLVCVYGVPRNQGSITVVDATATWKLNGEAQGLERTGANAIPIKVNEGGSNDMNLGKAVRKLMASIYERLTGSAQGDVDPANDPDPIDPSQAMLGDARQQDTFDSQAHPSDDYQQAPRDRASDNRPGGEVDPWSAIEARYANCLDVKQVANLTAKIRSEWPDVDAGRLKTLDQVHQKRVRAQKR